MKSTHYLFIALAMLLMMSFVTHASYTSLDQSVPTFTSEPLDAEIDFNTTLSLTWDISNSENTEYEIYMTRSDNTTLIGTGEVKDGSVTLYLDHLFEGEYEFSFNLIHSGGDLWSYVTITVVEPTVSTSDGSSDDGFISGYTFIFALMVYPVMVKIRSRTRSRKK